MSLLRAASPIKLFLNGYLEQNMCKLVSFVLNVLLSGTVATLITPVIQAWQGNIRRKKQNKYQDAKANLPILIEILEDLKILEQACVFHGAFCPLLEHRMPEFSDKDGVDASKMSYAQRGHQFRLIGHRIIRNCSKMIFLTPEAYLPQTLEVCRNIKNFLCSKKTPNSKSNLDVQIGTLINVLSPQDPGIVPGNIINSWRCEVKEFAEKINQFHGALEIAIEKELPLLSE